MNDREAMLRDAAIVRGIIAQAQREARADERELISRKIRRSALSGEFDVAYGRGWLDGIEHAAQIARRGSDDE